MKDFRLAKELNCFKDVIPKVVDGKIVFETIENEEKLSQTLTKILFTPIETHPLNIGIDHNYLDEEELRRALDIYASFIESTNDREIPDSASIKKIDDHTYEVEIKTRASTSVILKIGE